MRRVIDITEDDQIAIEVCTNPKSLLLIFYIGQERTQLRLSIRDGFDLLSALSDTLSEAVTR